MPRISVFLPTHEHASTLPYAVRSVQRQGVDDLEILICGDGVSDELRAVIAGLQGADPRIRFFDLPKAPRRGELNRDLVMRQAKGRIICHQNDDDLWLPGHIEMLEHALADADFVGAMQVNVGTDGKVRAHYFDLERPEFVEPWLDWRPHGFGSWACNGFGPIFVAHRLDAFLRLPEGWTTTPDGLPADQIMWHRFLRQPWCRAKFLRWPIALHFPSPDRFDWSPDRRADELRRWTEIIESPDYAVRIWRDVMPDLGDRLLRQSVEDRDRRQALTAAHEAAAARAQALRAEVNSGRREIDAALVRERTVQEEAGSERLAALARERALHDTAEACRLETEAVLMREKALQSEVESQQLAIEAVLAREAALQARETALQAEMECQRLTIHAAHGREEALQKEAESRRVEIEGALARERTLHGELDARRRDMDATLMREQALHGEVEAQRREIEAARVRGETLQAEVDAQRLTIETAVAHERRLQAEIESQRRTIAAGEAALARERAARADAEGERDALLASTSWRMTDPLRRAARWMRRLKSV